MGWGHGGFYCLKGLSVGHVHLLLQLASGVRLFLSYLSLFLIYLLIKN